VVKSRQEAVTELRPRLDLRERLAVLTEDARTGVDADSLAAWGEAPQGSAGAAYGSRCGRCTLLGIGGAAGPAVALLLHFDRDGCAGRRHAPVAPRSVPGDAAINGWFYYRQHQSAAEVVASVDRAGHELGLISRCWC